uniref:Uncharacterized protein LOC111138212 isoform X1 n=1 Tax=Crassostrea virginica TaxID=6565 RepID=A0A8B8F1U6_CRAVI|nr:uncharacterized protein LOC111138212 isoform X1 [Crassostrea virginica]
MAASPYDLVVFFLSTFIIVGNTQSTCRPTGSDGIPICCPYFYIKENSCLECPVGYQVLFDDYNCSIPCYYPSYGKRCGKTCGCSKEDCNHVQGCPVISTPVTSNTDTVFGISKKNTSTNGSMSTTFDEEPFEFKYLSVGVGIFLIVIMMTINVVNVHSWKQKTRDADEAISSVV